jgi:hypothetical protein
MSLKLNSAPITEGTTFDVAINGNSLWSCIDTGRGSDDEDYWRPNKQTSDFQHITLHWKPVSPSCSIKLSLTLVVPGGFRMKSFSE